MFPLPCFHAHVAPIYLTYRPRECDLHSLTMLVTYKAIQLHAFVISQQHNSNNKIKHGLDVTPGCEKGLKNAWIGFYDHLPPNDDITGAQHNSREILPDFIRTLKTVYDFEIS